jgi:ribosome-associated protein
MTEQISKSARKRRFKQEEEGAEEIALLSDKDLKNFPGSKDVKNAIIACRRLKGGARKRQIKYLAKVMRSEAVDEILYFLAEKKGSQLKNNIVHKEAERLRDVIINEAIADRQDCLQHGLVWEPDWSGEKIDAAVHRYSFDEGDLRKSVYQYVRTRIHGHYREVFRILKAAVEKDEFQRRLECQ